MGTREIQIKRFTLTSQKPFAEVVAAIDAHIGHPDMHGFRTALASAATLADVERVISAAASSAGLIEFARLDLGTILRKEMGDRAPKVLRIIAGNPLIMKEMVKHVHDAGSYAPVTILVDERDGGVTVSYDLMESFLAPYENEAALRVARELDAKVTKILTSAVA
jgi:uncharacterized protein (DUF302 family)